jgi:hypothetical protein
MAQAQHNIAQYNTTHRHTQHSASTIQAQPNTTQAQTQAQHSTTQHKCNTHKYNICYRITCNCDRVVTNFLIRCITLFTYDLYLPLSVISSFGTPINIVNLALPFYLPYWYVLFPRLLSYMFLLFIVIPSLLSLSLTTISSVIRQTRQILLSYGHSTDSNHVSSLCFT